MQLLKTRRGIDAQNNRFVTHKSVRRMSVALVALFFIAVQLLSPASLFMTGRAYADDDDQNTTQNPPQTVTPAANPPMSNSCGLDIALVLDNSTSISSSELTTMKSAMTAFTSAFTGTPTQFSVTHFATTATVDQGFTANVSTVNSAINGIPSGGGSTNWEDGLTKAKSTFDPRPSVPNVVIFASDGNPNHIGNGTSTTEANAVAHAVTVANTLKQAPYSAHIMALGIGNNLDVANLQAISGAGDVITSDFSTLAADLATLSTTVCGGTITTTKLIDQDGNLNTTNDRVPAQGWTFDVNGSPSNPAATATDANGQTPAVKVDPGTYSVNETPQVGYQLLSASCSGAASNGSQSGNAVSGITIAANNITSCTFINAPSPTLTLVKTVVNDNGGTKTAADFQGKIDGSSVAWETPITVTPGQHTASEASLPTYQASTWSGDCAANGTITVALGQNATCYITNDDISPVLTVTKEVVNPYGNPALPSLFSLYVDATKVKSGEANQFNQGTHSISEIQLPGYTLTGVSGDCVTDDDVISVLLSLSEDATCTLTNTAIQPKLVVTKHVINDNGGEKTASDFTMTVSDNSAMVPNFDGDEAGTTVNLNEGDYTVGETSHEGYAQTLSEGCTGSISIGETKECVITNDDIAPKLTLHKQVINDNGGTAEPADWTLVATPVDDSYPVLSGNGYNGFWEKDAAAHTTYTLSEANGPEGYEAGSWYCISESGVFSNPDGINSMIRMSEGANVSCTITNDDIAQPGIAVEKSGPATAYAGDTVEYTFTVTNTGNVPIGDISAYDSIAGYGVYQSGDTNTNSLLDTDETWVFTASYAIPGDQTEDVVNTVKVCGYEYQPEEDIIYGANPLSVLTRTLDDNQQEGGICAKDSHTLTITPTPVKPPVVTADPAQPVLASSGETQTAWATVVALTNAVLAVGTFTVARRRRAVGDSVSQL